MKMKLKYRIADCLVTLRTKERPDAKLEIAKYAITPDHKRHRIHTHENLGFDYFFIDHPTAPFGLYIRHIQDAVIAVRAGYAHALLGTLFPRTQFETRPSPIFILDEELGEKYRTQTLEEFKDTEFCYSIEVNNRNSYLSARHLDAHGHVMSYNEYMKFKPIEFNTRQDAEAYIKTQYDVVLDAIEKTIETNEWNPPDTSEFTNIMYGDLISRDRDTYASKFDLKEMRSKFMLDDMYVDVLQEIRRKGDKYGRNGA